MKKLFALLLVFGLFLAVAKGASAATVKGEANDLNNPGLGLVKYLGNPSGYHFWFTPTTNIGSWYLAGHSYHNVYKFELDDSSDWCPTQAMVPNRAPYNLVADPGTMVWYKIYDVTTDTYVCGME